MLGIVEENNWRPLAQTAMSSRLRSRRDQCGCEEGESILCDKNSQSSYAVNVPNPHCFCRSVYESCFVYLETICNDELACMKLFVLSVKTP